MMAVQLVDCSAVRKAALTADKKDVQLAAKLVERWVVLLGD